MSTALQSVYVKAAHLWSAPVECLGRPLTRAPGRALRLTLARCHSMNFTTFHHRSCGVRSATLGMRVCYSRAGRENDSWCGNRPSTGSRPEERESENTVKHSHHTVTLYGDG